MIYPEFLKKNDTIGITAPSDGITNPIKLHRLDNAIFKFNKHGFKIRETSNVRSSEKGKSSSSPIQAMELEQLYEDETVKAIICAGGGDFLLEMLPFINFDKIKQSPKWIQGFSDPTGLLFTITTNLDIATIYSDNICSFGMKDWHLSLKNNLEILKGNLLKQNSFDKFQKEYMKYITGEENYNLDTDVYWKITNQKEITIEGRIIGGCIDILSDLFGTRFDKTIEFIDKYKSDGIIWYFDNAELSSEQIRRTLWKFKGNGWFEHTNGILFSRDPEEKSYYNISYEEAIKESLGDLGIPIIINTDIGHVAPRLTIINGAIAHIHSVNGTGEISFELH